MTEKPASSPPIRLVLIEDQPSILKKQVRLLAAFEELEIVATARDGKAGLLVIEAHTPDVVLLDLGLPDMSGIQVTREVKARFPAIEILIFTIFEEETQVARGCSRGRQRLPPQGDPRRADSGRHR